MILNNSTADTALFQITSANGREISADMNASTYQNVDLSKYRSPFSVEVTVGTTKTDMIYKVGVSQIVSVYRCAEGYKLSATSAA